MAIIAGEIAGLVLSIQKHGFWGQFVYYTQCSNYLLLIATAVHLAFLVRNRRDAEKARSKSEINALRMAERAKYYATCLTTVTFAVTVCILIPWYGHPEFFLLQSNGLFQHLLCPVLAAASLPLLGRMKKQDSIYAMIPTIIYGIVMYTMNFLRAYDGPYPFLRVHDQPWYMSVLWFLIIAGAAYGIAAGLRRLCGIKSTGKQPEQ